LIVELFENHFFEEGILVGCNFDYINPVEKYVRLHFTKLFRLFTNVNRERKNFDCKNQKEQ